VGVRRTSSGEVLSLVLATFVVVGQQSPANAGIFDCWSPKKWSSYSKLRTAFNKDPQLKTEDDWFKAYIFARIFTGSSKCFKAQDVAVMKKWVNAYNQACINDPSWNYSCKISVGTSTLSSWVYEGYK